MVREKGSITVFLSLTGLLIFALLGTLVETARYTVCKNHVARTLQTATEGLMTEYSRPLYDKYGLFFIESEGTPYERVIADYAGDTMEASGKGNKDFMAGHLSNLEITRRTYLGDNKAAALQQEITDYMGRVVTKESLNKLQKKSSYLQNVEEEAKKIERTVETEQEEAKMDKQLLELMRLVDGISVSGGVITCSDDFIKCFATRGKKGQDFSISEAVIWQRMKKHIDERTQTWKVKNKSAFLNKLVRVKQMTAQAIRIGQQIEMSYSGMKTSAGENKSMLQNLVSALPSLQTNRNILQTTEDMLREKSVDECREELVRLWKDYDTTSIVFDYTGVQESGGGDNPKEALGSAWGKGIINLVCKEPEKISNKSIANPDSFLNYYEQQEEAISYEERISDFTKKDTVELGGTLGGIGEYALNEFCLDKYIENKFGSYIKKIPEWKQVLDYGVEYVIAGKNSDRDNLKSVLNRILLMRTVVNYTAISRDKAKQAQAQAAALAVVGFTGLQLLITLTKTLILITWSIVESMVDIAGLLLQKHVPVLKKPSQITTSFPQVFEINRTDIVSRASKLKGQGSQSFRYQDYLLLFLASTGQSTRLYRVMDLIQHNMRANGYSGFLLGNCVYEIKVKGTMSFPSQFFRLSVLEKMLGRSLQDYLITREVVVSY